MTITTLNEYQALAMRSAIYPGRGATSGVAYTALGLAGEAGEVANKVKKVLRDGRNDMVSERQNRYDQIASELGDVLWYVAAVAYELGYDLETIARLNVEKLRERKERGTLSGSGSAR